MKRYKIINHYQKTSCVRTHPTKVYANITTTVTMVYNDNKYSHTIVTKVIKVYNMYHSVTHVITRKGPDCFAECEATTFQQIGKTANYITHQYEWETKGF